MMGGDTGRPPGREPTYLDYLTEAFNLRVHVPGLGGLPINWLYLAAVAGMGAAMPPLLLIGAAGELAYLTGLAGSARFRRAVRARWQQRHGLSREASLQDVVGALSAQSRRKYEDFCRNCSDVLEIAGQIGTIADPTMQTYAESLAQLRRVYARMLLMVDTFARYSQDWSKTDPRPEIAAIEAELKKPDLPPAIRASRQATLDILNKRAQSRQEIVERVGVIQSEMQRLEQRLALLRDQALLTRDPTVLSTSMDEAAGLLEQHTAWLQENSALLESMDQV